MHCKIEKSERMDARLLILVIVFSSSFCVEQDIYVNTTNDMCLSGGFQCEHLTKTITLRLHKKAVISVLYFGNECVTFETNVSKNRINISQTTPDYTVCLLNVTKADAGIYTFEGLSFESFRLFVLEKPDLPKMTILYNGTVNISAAQIRCKSTSNSAPVGLNISYMWFVNTSIIDTNNAKYYHLNGDNSVLFIHVNMADKANDYSCMATELYGQSTSSNYVINIFPGSVPLVDILPEKSSLTIVEYDNLTLVCKARAAVPPVSSYTWYRDREVLHNVVSDILVLNNITRHDAGYYNCTASNGLEINGSDIIYVDVLFGPDIAHMMSVAQEDGFGLNITCNITSNPKIDDNNVIWSRDNSSHFYLNGKTLFIPHVNIQDDGQFLCRINLTLIPTNGHPVVKYSSKILDVNVLYGPRVSSSFEVIPEEGDNVNMSCQIDSNPQATDDNVSWYFHSSVDSLPVRIGNGITRQITAIQRNESGQYVCMVNITLTPTHGNHIVRYNSSTVLINVLYQPSITQFDSKTVHEDEVVNLSCKVIGNPMARVHWVYAPTNQTFSEYIAINHSSIEVSSILRFPEARCNDTGSYVCVANNGIKKAVYKSSSLFVNCSPRLDNQRLPDRNITVKKNEPLNFTEWFYAYPQPSFHLSKSNSTEPIERHGFTITNETDQQFSYIIGSRIQKPEFEKSDIGNYVLVATNNIGHVNVSYNIIYTRKPEKPFNVRVSCGDMDSTAVVKWNAGWDGGSNQTFYIVYRQTKNKNISLGTNSPIEEKSEDLYSHSLFGLLPNENYIFIVKVSNDIGYQESEEINCTTTGILEAGNSDSMLIGLGSGGTMVIVVILVTAVVIFSRRKERHRKGKKNKLIKSRGDQESKHSDIKEYKNPESNQHTYMGLQFHQDCNNYSMLGDSSTSTKQKGDQLSRIPESNEYEITNVPQSSFHDYMELQIRQDCNKYCTLGDSVPYVKEATQKENQLSSIPESNEYEITKSSFNDYMELQIQQDCNKYSTLNDLVPYNKEAIQNPVFPRGDSYTQ